MTGDERDELVRLRRENRVLRVVLPVVMAERTDGTWTTLLDVDALRACDGDVDSPGPRGPRGSRGPGIEPTSVSALRHLEAGGSPEAWSSTARTIRCATRMISSGSPEVLRDRGTTDRASSLGCDTGSSSWPVTERWSA